MNGRELVVLLACLACATGAILFVVHQMRGPGSQHRRRFDALVASLQDPALDPNTRAEVLRALARDHAGWGGRLWAKLSQPVLWKALWFGAGWFLFVLAGTALAMHATRIVEAWQMVPMLTMLTAVGFAMVSMPMAWREATRRSHAGDAA
ncbi:MAG: hypothetical protein JNK15_07830 [Planctomycetes bacterium]|nr:hypothetical protein [Planctomycetota bacterium]